MRPTARTERISQRTRNVARAGEYPVLSALNRTAPRLRGLSRSDTVPRLLVAIRLWQGFGRLYISNMDYFCRLGRVFTRLGPIESRGALPLFTELPRGADRSGRVAQPPTLPPSSTVATRQYRPVAPAYSVLSILGAHAVLSVTVCSRIWLKLSVAPTWTR